MSDPRVAEPPFEILMVVSQDGGTTPPAPRAPAPETPSPGSSPVKEPWFFVTHFLVLFVLAGGVVWVLGLTWLGRPSREGSRAQAVPASAALAVVRSPVSAPPSPVKPPENPEPPPQGGRAEGPHLEGSAPPGLPPAPAALPVV